MPGRPAPRRCTLHGERVKFPCAVPIAHLNVAGFTAASDRTRPWMEHLRNPWNSFSTSIGKFMLLTAPCSHPVLTSRAAWLALLLAIPLCAYAGRAYVTNEDAESISVLDTDKAEVVSTVNVGKRPR